jgi:hypothetical protein
MDGGRWLFHSANALIWKKIMSFTPLKSMACSGDHLELTACVSSTIIQNTNFNCEIVPCCPVSNQWRMENHNSESFSWLQGSTVRQLSTPLQSRNEKRDSKLPLSRAKEIDHLPIFNPSINRTLTIASCLSRQCLEIWVICWFGRVSQHRTKDIISSSILHWKTSPSSYSVSGCVNFKPQLQLAVGLLHVTIAPIINYWRRFVHCIWLYSKDIWMRSTLLSSELQCWKTKQNWNRH